MDTFGRYVRKPCQGDLKGVLKMESILTQEQIDSLSEAIQIIADAIVEVVHHLANVVVQAWDDLILSSGTGKIKHLALHAKKKRIRKKNFHRLQKKFLKL